MEGCAVSARISLLCPATRRVPQNAFGRSVRPPPVRAQAPAASTSASVEEAVGLLHSAAKSPTVPPKELFAAMRQLERAAPPSRDELAAWPVVLGGSVSPGHRWRLVFTTGTKDVQAALKGVGTGGGSYFPLTAVQRWDAAKGEIENGIYLGRVAALTFRGPYSFEGKILAFDFDTLVLRLGPLTLPIPLKDQLPRKAASYRRTKESPFFSFFYVDERVVAARGRGGGIALWARTSPTWELEKGIV